MCHFWTLHRARRTRGEKLRRPGHLITNLRDNRVLRSTTGGRSSGRKDAGRRKLVRRDRGLLKRAKKFQSEDLQVAQGLLTANLSGDRGGLAGNQAGARGCRRRDGQMNGLPGPQHVSGGYTRTPRTDIKSPSQLHEFQASCIISAKKYRDLDADSGGGTGARRIHSGLILCLVDT
jgi:hypothetical protein